MYNVVKCAGHGASEPSRPSGSVSDGEAGEEKQTGATLSVGGDGEDDEDLLRGGEPTATGQIHRRPDTSLIWRRGPGAGRAE